MSSVEKLSQTSDSLAEDGNTLADYRLSMTSENAE
jgi:hypothetical protein